LNTRSSSRFPLQPASVRRGSRSFIRGRAKTGLRLLFTLFFLTYLPLQADSFDRVGTSSATFLKLPVGARSLAMGTAVTASVSDGTAAFWNPAGLMLHGRRSLSLQHFPYVLDISSQYFSLSFPYGNRSALALSVLSLNTPKQEITTVDQEDGNGIFYQVNDLAIGLSLAQQLSDRLNYGITAKYIRSNAHQETASALALDIGSILNTQMYGLRIGMALSNFGSELQYSGADLLGSMDRYPDSDSNYPEPAYASTQNWPLPLGVRIGLAMLVSGASDQSPLFSSSLHQLLIELNAYHPNDNSEQLNLGMEYGWNHQFFLRTGYQFNSDLYSFSAGAGLKLINSDGLELSADFGWASTDYFGNLSQISLELGF